MKKRMLCSLMAIITVLVSLPASAFARDEMKNTDPDKYYVLLDVRNQFVTVYEKDDQGEYSKVVRRFLCTTGKTKPSGEGEENKATPTPAGRFRIGAKERFGKFAAFGGEYARYWTQVVRGIYFHSIMFGDRTVNSLKGSPFRNLGRNTSHGCIRLYVEDAKWIYYYCPAGTLVNVSYSEPSQPEIRKALRTDLSFDEYNALQKGIYDEPELPNKTAWVSVDRAEVRTGNGTNDSYITTLEHGAEVEVLQEGDPWVKVIYNSEKKREGYVKLAYLTYEKGFMQSKEDADLIVGTTPVYTAPDTESETLFQLPDSMSVKILDDSDEKFNLIETNGKQGYVKKSRMKKGWGTIRE